MRPARPLVLLLILAAGLGAVFFLPKVTNTTPQGIALNLPTFVGEWYGTDQAVTPMERQILAKDTEFSRKLYTDATGDHIFVSIVLSGQDLDNSIHRPERCLPAQGWSVADSRVISIPVTTAPDGSLAVTRLHDVREVPTNDGKTASIYNLNYYWFVGWKTMTPSHLKRTYIDIRDRILYGYNQRWAYVTIASEITSNVSRFGKNEQQTDKMLQGFIQGLFPLIDQEGNASASGKSEKPETFASQ